MPAKKNIARYTAARSRAEAALKRVSVWRLAIFGVLILSLLAAVSDLQALYAAPLLIALFIWLVRKTNRITNSKELIELKIAFLNENEIRQSDKWKTLSPPQSGAEFQPFHTDLNLVGNASFWQRYALVGSPFGRAALAERLIQINSLTENDILRDQAQVQLHAPNALRRQTLFSLIRQLSWNEEDILAFGAWMEKKHTLPRSLQMARLLAVGFALNTVAAIWLNTGLYVGVQLLVNFLFVQIFYKDWVKLYKEGLSKEEKFRIFADIFCFIQRRYTAERKPLKEDLPETDLAHVFMEFQKQSDRLSLVYSGMGYALMNALCFWDAWHVPRLLKWKATYAPQFKTFFKLLGEIEANESLGNMAYLNKNYVYPTLATKTEFSASNMAHPLISKADVVANSFTASGGEVHLISGSNMAGKTTFLRTVGINAALSYLGLPVPATSLKLAVFNVASSITISDSLSDGVSFFYAEVRQLKHIVEQAKQSKPLLYFVDEMLKGTNARERSLACENVIRQLLQTEAIGLFSTHDLSLTKLEREFKGAVINSHFAERDSKDRLTFDYKRKDGVVQSSNALAILEREGLLKN